MKAVVCIILVLCPILLSAQDDTKYPLTENSRAVNFQVTSNLTLSSFQGTTFSYQYNIKQYTAIRLGLSMNTGDMNSDGSSRSVQDDTVFSSLFQNSERTNIDLRINAQAIFYTEPVVPVVFYYGMGPTFGVSYLKYNSSSERSYGGGGHYESSSEIRTTSYIVGLTGLAGGEWFVTRTVSFHAEYTFGLMYTWSKSEGTDGDLTYNSSRSTSSTSSSIQGTGQGVLFGMSVYFR